MHEAGRAVPGELSVVGFDDIPEAPYFLPPLTTIRQDFNEMGTRSLRALLRTDRDRRTASVRNARPARADHPQQHGPRAPEPLTPAACDR